MPCKNSILTPFKLKELKFVINIARNEIIILWRRKGFQWLLLALLVFTGYAIVSSVTHYREVHTKREALKDSLREMFLHQDPKSPHIAGHYGHIVFKPYSILQAIDQGVESYTGTTIRLEAHRQNDAVFSPASTQSSLIRFGEFSFSILLQVVVPLLIIFICYGSIVTDRKNGTLKILLSQGASLRKLVFSKIVAYHTFFTAFLALIIALFYLFISVEIGNAALPMVAGRLLLIIILYAMYYGIVIALTIYFSAVANSIPGLLTSLLAIWFIWTIILPKLTASLGAVSYPLITKAQFNQELASLKANELNGHDWKNEKTKAFIDSVLTSHHVDSVQQLPFRLKGLLMQADEEVKNRIHDKVFSNVRDTIRLQNNVSSFSGIINPFIAVKKLSMALSFTDVYHHFHFLEEAESYRRRLIKELNDEDTHKHSEFKDERGRVSADFWARIQDFEYKPAPLPWSLSNSKIEIAVLFLWLFITFGIIYNRTPNIGIV